MYAPFFPPNQAFHFILFLCETHSGFVSFPHFTSWWLDVKHLGCPLSMMQYTHTHRKYTQEEVYDCNWKSYTH